MGCAGSKEENVESAGRKGKEEGGSEHMGCRRKEKQMIEELRKKDWEVKRMRTEMARMQRVVHSRVHVVGRGV